MKFQYIEVFGNQDVRTITADIISQISHIMLTKLGKGNFKQEDQRMSGKYNLWWVVVNTFFFCALNTLIRILNLGLLIALHFNLLPSYRAQSWQIVKGKITEMPNVIMPF